MTRIVANTRTAYVVQTPEGFLGTRRFSHAKGGTHSHGDRPFSSARIFARQQDADMSRYTEDRVREVTITLKEAQ